MITMKGALTVAGGVFIHVALGVLFTFGNISPYITSYLRFHSSSSNLQYSDSMWIMSYIQVSLHIALMCGGMIEVKLGARITSLLGGLSLSLGLVLTYFAAQHSFTATTITYGWIFGLGIGIGYTSSLGRAMEWFPNEKGLVSGLVIGGSGVAAIIFNLMETAYTNPNNLIANVTVWPNNDKYFSQSEVLNRVPSLFLLLGCVCGVLSSIGALLLFKPPSDVVEKPKLEKSPFQELTGTDEQEDDEGNSLLTDNRKSDQSVDIHPLKLIKTKQFWILWFLSLVNGEAVIFVSSFYKAYGETFISNDHFLALVGSVGTGFISVGRIFWGFVIDRLPLKLGLVVQNAAMVFLLLTFTVSEKAGKWMYFIWVVTMFGTMAGTTTSLTAATATTFGLKYFSTNYGLVSSSMIFGGILGSILSQNLTDHIGWFGIFALIAGFSFLGVVLSYIFDFKNGADADRWTW